jgi:hypothetical protein
MLLKQAYLGGGRSEGPRELLVEAEVNHRSAEMHRFSGTSERHQCAVKYSYLTGDLLARKYARSASDNLVYCH